MRTRSRSSQGDDAGTASAISAQPEEGPSQEALSSRRTRRTTAEQADVAASQLPVINEEPPNHMTPRPRRQSRSSASQVQQEAMQTPPARKSVGRRKQQQNQGEAHHQLDHQEQQPHDDQQQEQQQQQQQQQEEEEEQQEEQHIVLQHERSAAETDPSDSEASGRLAEDMLPSAPTVATISTAATSGRLAAASKSPIAPSADWSSSDSDDEGSMDSEAMLERLAASIGAAFGGAAAAGPSSQQQQRDHAAVPAVRTAAAASNSEAHPLTWQPDTGLRPLITFSAAVPSTSAAAGTQQPGTQLPTKERGLAGQLQVPPRDAVRAAREARKAAPDTAGAKWYGLPATKIDEDMKRDLRLLRLRGAYDPKRFYKSFDKGKFPKYFQVGTVVNDPLDFYGGRLTKAERKTTLTEQLLADTDLTHNRKKRYSKLQVEAQKYVKVKKRKTDLPRNKSPHHRPKH